MVGKDRVKRGAWLEECARGALGGGSLAVNVTLNTSPSEEAALLAPGLQVHYALPEQHDQQILQGGSSVSPRPQTPSARILPTPLSHSTEVSPMSSPRRRSFPASSHHKCRPFDSGPPTAQLGSPGQVPFPLCASHLSPVKCPTGPQGCCHNPRKANSLGPGVCEAPGNHQPDIITLEFIYLYLSSSPPPKPEPCSGCLSTWWPRLSPSGSFLYPGRQSFPTQQPEESFLNSPSLGGSRCP